MTAATVTVCGCGHAERMHERDAAAEHDRGACMHGSCGCSAFQPGMTGLPAAAVAIPAEAPAPVASPAVVAVLPAKQPTCPDCRKVFGTVHGLNVHRSLQHKPAPDYRQIAREIEAKSEPKPEPAPEVKVEPAPPAPEAEAAPPVSPDRQPAQPRREVKDHRTITVKFPAGWVDLEYEIDWAALTFDERSALAEWTNFLYRLGHVDYFAAMIGDPNSDEFDEGTPS